jgi:hypothetical protein
MNSTIPEGVNNYVLKLLITEKKNLNEIKEILIEKGISDEESNNIIKNILEKIIKARKEKSKNDFIYGFILLGIGLTITLITYFLAKDDYFSLLIISLIGIIRIIRGLLRRNY